MSRETSFLDATVNSDSLETPVLEHSIGPDSPANTDTSTNFSNGAFISPQMDESITPSSQPAQVTSSRVPIMGISSSQFTNTSGSAHRHRQRPRKTPRKHLRMWSSSPKLTSSHFCEHIGMFVLIRSCVFIIYKIVVVLSCIHRFCKCCSCLLYCLRNNFLHRLS